MSGLNNPELSCHYTIKNVLKMNRKNQKAIHFYRSKRKLEKIEPKKSKKWSENDNCNEKRIIKKFLEYNGTESAWIPG